MTGDEIVKKAMMTVSETRDTNVDSRCNFGRAAATGDEPADPKKRSDRDSLELEIDAAIGRELEAGILVA